MTFYQIFVGHFRINEEKMKLLRQIDNLQKEFLSPLKHFLHFSGKKKTIFPNVTDIHCFREK